MSKSVAIITMSTRGTRVGPNIAAFVKKTIQGTMESDGISLTDVDVVKFNLPVYNEAAVPAMIPEKASFQYEHSKAWSAEIKKHDGYVLVIPEYNFAMAGGTKNAIDYLMHEWTGKPAAVVSYGGKGGVNASEQVSGVLSAVGLKVAETRPNLAFVGQADTFAAVTAGKLGDETAKAWEAEHAESIRKAATELKELLLNPNTKENALKA
ncbi:NADPH-dependent FMN reductase family protein [Hypomontagnella monticulosa]|nr:NADPH-dependent FMN reductase family protein [Hypomontagnella monticulosa]